MFDHQFTLNNLKGMGSLKYPKLMKQSRVKNLFHLALKVEYLMVKFLILDTTHQLVWLLKKKY